MKKSAQSTAKQPHPIRPIAFDNSEYTSIIWLGGAGFLLNIHGRIILIDPVLTTIPNSTTTSETGLELKIPYPIKATDIPKADMVLYTHSDSDHLGRMTAATLDRLNPRFIGPPPVFQQLIKIGIKYDKIETCRTGDCIEIGNYKILVTPADHPWQLLDPEKNGKPFRVGDCCGFIIETLDARCFFPGDTRLMEEHLAIKNIDVLALDVSQDPYHLNHHGAIVLANTMLDALLIPIHYGTYDAPGKPAHSGNPRDVFNKVKNSEKRARILAPGEMLVMKDHAEIISFMP
jgi:L-ascorbate metabolism protein UlaG (beta-lactamase superfamily)